MMAASRQPETRAQAVPVAYALIRRGPGTAANAAAGPGLRRDRGCCQFAKVSPRLGLRRLRVGLGP